MARNVEIKARLRDAADVARVHERAVTLADHGPELIEQDDTFFACAEGRLKLRAFADGSGELIAYRRTDVNGPKTSDYRIAPVGDSIVLRETLAWSLGVTGRVIKQRTLYLVGRTRVHVDRVEGLGDFLELEVVLRDGEPQAHGVAEARVLLERLGVAADALVAGAYVDLLRAGR